LYKIEEKSVTLPFTVQLPMLILCTYFSNYNYWVITSTNPEPTPKPTPVPCTYLILAVLSR